MNNVHSVFTRLFIAATLSLAVVFPAWGKGSLIVITPSHLYGPEFVFAVTTKPASNGRSFHVTISAKKGTFLQDLGGRASLGLFKVTETERGRERSISPLEPETPLALKRGRRVWKANFVASNQLLSNPDTCFVFTARHDLEFGVDVYVLKLRDFIKQ